MTTPIDNASPAPALDRGLAILETVLERGDPVPFNTLVNDLGVPPASAARLLRVLQKRRFLTKDEDSGYLPGPRVAELTSRAPLHERLRDLAGPILKSLRRATGNTALLIYWNGEILECLAKETDENAIAMQRVGDLRTDLFAYPWSPFVWEDLQDRGHTTEELVEMGASADRMKAGLDECHAAGYIFADSPSIRRFTAPILGPDRRLVGAIGLGGTHATVPDDRIHQIGSAVADHAKELSLTPDN